MSEKIICLRCGCQMHLIRQENLQLGKTSWVFGDLDNLLAGAIAVDILCCPECGKMEFFRSNWSGLREQGEGDRIARTKCPRCGKAHDLDDPKCPACGMDNPYF